MDPARFKKLPILGILRGGSPDIAEPLAQAVIAAGLETLEVAMNTPDAAAVLSRLRDVSGNRLCLGAGTVTTLDRLAAAKDAGATFMVMPTLVSEVVEACAKNGIPVFPGALTPQEISDAWNAGATMVKVFPASAFGPGYLKEVLGPFQDIELLACGGIRAANAGEYFAAGASAVAFGGSVFGQARLDAGDFAAVETDVRALVGAARLAAPKSHLAGA